ncbi:hypothetical protein B296_00055313 [Ensete ventricosum]|uniref:Neprosin PEP catalytic domain-containing protein n=1 Tax=Ensete ventricosum TaxID=4639 RepID=A0A426XGP3_ENSVE|nr:hypothetical protein B296_00055313 [Ensete ventricosum]
MISSVASTFTTIQLTSCSTKFSLSELISVAFEADRESPDGDLIDCVPSHLQPAFDHPKLRGQRPSDPPERPKGNNLSSTVVDVKFLAWTISGESCPEGTVPIRRTSHEDILRASSIQGFGRKPAAGRFRRDSGSTGHEIKHLLRFMSLLFRSLLHADTHSYRRALVQHAVGYVMGAQYYGAKASLSVWAPSVTSVSEFSLSQMWVISGSFGNDLNTIEAGWQVIQMCIGFDLFIA